MDKERKELYDALAADIPLVREILDGTTTFAESLDQIAAAIEEHDDNAGKAVVEWYASAALLTTPPLTAEESGAMLMYAITYSKKFSKMRHLIDGTSIGLGAVIVALGTYLKRDPRLRKMATLYQIAGGGAVGLLGYRAVKYHLKGKDGKATVEGYLDRMMATAKELDRDVAAYHLRGEDETFDEARPFEEPQASESAIPEAAPETPAAQEHTEVA